MLNITNLIQTIRQNVAQVIVGKDEIIDLLLTAMLCEGHVLGRHIPAHPIYARSPPLRHHRCQHL